MSIDPPEETTLIANSVLANKIKRVAKNDGSTDNIIYNANCFTIQLPVTVTVNGIVLTITEISNYEDLEDLLDEFDDDDDIVEITFPITIILADFTRIEVNSLGELEDYADDCNGENEEDDDIECIDFVYPVTASVFNSNNEIIATLTFNSDNELYDFIDDLDEDDLVGFDFPISIIISDGSEIVVNNFNELEQAIDNYEDDCDEDDDYDYNDDDCDDCTTSGFESILTNCADWTVEELELDDVDLEDQYVDYIFSFESNGTITVTNNGNTIAGTWSTSGTGNNISFNINIPDLTDFNRSWILHEIEQESGETEFELQAGDDELVFKSDSCN
ncbi:hypothetical protein NMS_1385 [Nonlabens marinus S1-08]|uniref:Uncharacterized protein n=1 Tax=Nonlabens marinus S1-08 TaxID=1454201 RepID=W8VQ14_9FLAO|nr:hypothetical protein NMS_1385 [Nonlabens marinus S1-08]